MEIVNKITYDIEKSAARIDDILNGNDINYSDQDSIAVITHFIQLKKTAVDWIP